MNKPLAAWGAFGLGCALPVGAGGAGLIYLEASTRASLRDHGVHAKATVA